MIFISKQVEECVESVNSAENSIKVLTKGDESGNINKLLREP